MNSTQKVLIVSNSSGLITAFLKNDVEILKQRGFSVDCACNTNFPDSNTETFFEFNNINVFHVNFPLRNMKLKKIFESYISLKKIINEGSYDLIHCHSTIAATITRECARKERKKGLKIVYTSHGFPFYEGNEGIKSKIFYLIERYYSKYTDAILTICKEDYENAKKMKCKNIFFMHGVGVPVDSFINSIIDREDYRKKLGFLPTDKVVLSIGELNTNKNHQIVIRALAELNNPNLLFVICGRELSEIGKKQELQNLANSMMVRIRFLGFRKDISEICTSADIGVMPSYKEGLGLAGIEMLASGIPVVGSNRQGIKDYIINNITGFLADPEREFSFATAINSALLLKEKVEIKKECVKMAKKFDVQQAYNTISAVYDKVI